MKWILPFEDYHLDKYTYNIFGRIESNKDRAKVIQSFALLYKPQRLKIAFRKMAQGQRQGNHQVAQRIENHQDTGIS